MCCDLQYALETFAKLKDDASLFAAYKHNLNT